MDKDETCGTCKDWNFKVGGLQSGKEWGECLNEVVLRNVKISSPLPESYGLDKDGLMKLLKDIKDYCRIHFEEYHFGCVYHEK